LPIQQVSRLGRGACCDGFGGDGVGNILRIPTIIRMQQIRQNHSTPFSPAGKTPASTRIHRCTTTRALHHFLLARTQARIHGFHSNRASSSMLARTPASARFITAAAPHQPCRQEVQPVLGTTRASLFHDSPQPHHCWQELTPVHHFCQELHPALCNPSMQHQNAPFAGKELQPTLDAPHQPC